MRVGKWRARAAVVAAVVVVEEGVVTGLVEVAGGMGNICCGDGGEWI